MSRPDYRQARVSWRSTIRSYRREALEQAGSFSTLIWLLEQLDQAGASERYFFHRSLSRLVISGHHRWDSGGETLVLVPKGNGAVELLGAESDLDDDCSRRELLAAVLQNLSRLDGERGL